MQGGSTSCRGDVCLYPWVLCLLQGGLYLHPWVLCLLQGNSIYTHGTLLAPEGGLPTPMGALSAPRGVCLHPVGVYHLQGGCLSAPMGALPAPGGLRLHPWVLPPHLVTPPKTHRGAHGCRPHARGSSHSNRGDSGGVPRKKNGGGGVCVTVTLRSPNTPRVGGGASPLSPTCPRRSWTRRKSPSMQARCRGVSPRSFRRFHCGGEGEHNDRDPPLSTQRGPQPTLGVLGETSTLL